MKCLICGKEFIIKRNFRNLFSTKVEYVCDECLKENKFDVNYSKIPLSSHELTIVSLFSSKKYFNYSCFIYEYSMFYEKLFQTIKGQIIITYDTISINMELLDNIENISTLMDKNICFLTYYFQV